MKPRVTTHCIDRDDRMVFVDPQWLLFAVQNNAPELCEKTVLGRVLWDFIYDKETRHIYRILVGDVRRDKEIITVPFRCDSPDLIRVMEMQMMPMTEQGVRFDSLLLSEQARPAVRLLDPSQERSGELLTICSWCKKVRLPDNGWVEAQEAVKRLGLFADMPLPDLSHGVCPACNDIVFGKKRGK